MKAPKYPEAPRLRGGGIWLPHPCPLISGRGVAKAWRIFPSLEGWPTGRGVRFRLCLVGLLTTPSGYSPATPSRRGIWLPHPCPLISGRGAAKAWRIFPSLEGWPTGRGVRSLTHALSQRERGGRSMANIPFIRGVADRTGCSLPHPCPLPAREGRPKHGEYSPL